MFYVKHISISKLKKKLDRLFSAFIRHRDYLLGCISCGAKNVPWDEWQAGHFHDRAVSYASLYFDERNVNGQCKNCNEFRGGNKDGYVSGLIVRYGPEIIPELAAKKNAREQWGIFEYEAAIKKYQGIRV